MKKRQISVSAFCLIAVPKDAQLNDKAVEILAEKLKVNKDELVADILTLEKEAEKMATKLPTLTKDLHVFSTAEKDTLLDNHGKNKYNEGKLAGIEMPLKEAKEKLGMKESKARNWDEFLAEHSEKIKKESGVAEGEREKTLKEEKQALQDALKEKEKEVVKWKGEVENVRVSVQINNELEKALDTIQIEAPEELMAAQSAMLAREFKAQHEIKLEDGKTIVYKDGKKVVDHLQNPLTIKEALKQFAPKYVQIKVAKGRGEGSSKGTTRLSEELENIKTKADFLNYLAAKDINPSSDAAQKIFMEIRAVNKDFKLA